MSGKATTQPEQICNRAEISVQGNIWMWADCSIMKLFVALVSDRLVMCQLCYSLTESI